MDADGWLWIRMWMEGCECRWIDAGVEILMQMDGCIMRDMDLDG